ncbi:MAG: DUF547 domain-containing protein [Bacteroidota bacterium]
MNILIFSLCALLQGSTPSSYPYPAPSQAEVAKDPMALSAKLLSTVTAAKSPQNLQTQLRELSPNELAVALNTDDKRKAFWINVYNSYIISILKEQPALFEDRSAFFTKKRMTIAQTDLSFDDIEHGFLRRSKIKLSLGLLNNPFPGRVEKMFRVTKVDPRIHFALNCGAASCPPVRIYKADNIDKLLEKASKSYLQKTSVYNKAANAISITPLMSWFRGDFGGKKGVKFMLKKYKVIPKKANPSIDYLSYDWTLDLDNVIRGR